MAALTKNAISVTVNCKTYRIEVTKKNECNPLPNLDSNYLGTIYRKFLRQFYFYYIAKTE